MNYFTRLIFFFSKEECDTKNEAGFLKLTIKYHCSILLLSPNVYRYLLYMLSVIILFSNLDTAPYWY